MQLTYSPGSDAAILARVIQPGKNNLPKAAAEALLKLDFTADDRKRMRELAAGNREGNLTKTEQRELDSYLRIGRMVDLLTAKARLSLEKS